MGRNTQELGSVSIPAITCCRHDKLTALSPALGKLILKTEYPCVLTISGVQQMCGCKRMRAMPKQSSATQYLLGKASKEGVRFPVPALNPTHTTLIPSRANLCKALPRASGIALEPSCKPLNRDLRERNLIHQVMYLMRSRILHNITYWRKLS